jgi:Flp pilus assembly protein TadG
MVQGSNGYRPGKWGYAHGQSMAEFALITPLFIAVVFVAITFAIIGQTALAVTQLAYNGSRYAALNPSMTASALQTYIGSGAIGAPNITGANNGNTTVTVTQATGFGKPVTVKVSYDLANVGVVTSIASILKSLGIGASFPTTLSATEIAVSD